MSRIAVAGALAIAAPARWRQLLIERRLAVFACVPLLALAGCRTHNIDAVLTNHSDQKVSVVQVDYPFATFGKQTLAPGESYTYRFHAAGSGPVAVGYVDQAGHEHHAKGPELAQGDEGRLRIEFMAPDRVNIAFDQSGGTGHSSTPQPAASGR